MENESTEHELRVHGYGYHGPNTPRADRSAGSGYTIMEEEQRMNERIKQLAEQAKDHADYYAMLSSEPEQEIFTEKFAELIVQECLGIVDNAERGGSNDIWDNAVKFIKRDLQEHFGVKE